MGVCDPPTPRWVFDPRPAALGPSEQSLLEQQGRRGRPPSRIKNEIGTCDDRSSEIKPCTRPTDLTGHACCHYRRKRIRFGKNVRAENLAESDLKYVASRLSKSTQILYDKTTIVEKKFEGEYINSRMKFLRPQSPDSKPKSSDLTVEFAELTPPVRYSPKPCLARFDTSPYPPEALARLI
jgi:hypothetical protein